MTKLFSEFKPVDYETWINQLKKDLKDKPLEALESNPEKDIHIKAYYHPKEDALLNHDTSLANNFSRASNNWSVRRHYEANCNKQILTDLNEGIDAVGLTAISQNQFEQDSEGILFEHIVSDIRFNDEELALNLNVPSNSHLNFDLISQNIQAGKEVKNLHQFIPFFEKRKSQKCLWIDGFVYGNSGASTIQELAFALSHLNEYIHILNQAGNSLDEINESLILELSVNEDYFVNLAKFRAARELVALVFSAYDVNFKATCPTIYAKNTSRFLTVNDANNNFLRLTTQAMSAILGGCDVLTLSFPDSEHKAELNQRMAKNIQLVLREESYLDKVIDPAAGSLYIEDLTNQLIEKAWKLFQHIENRGGLIASIQTNYIQQLISENKIYLIDQVQQGKKTFLGINKYPSSLEKWIAVKEQDLEKTPTPFEPLHPFTLEHSYQPKTATV